MRRLLRRALERWTGDRYVRVSLVREGASTSPWTIEVVDAAIRHALAQEPVR